MIHYDNEQAVTAELQAFQAENEASIDTALNNMLTKIRAIYNKYNITTDTPFSELQRRISKTDAKELNDALYKLSKQIDDEDFNRELRPIANMTIYDSIGANIALGIASAFLAVKNKLAKQVQQSEQSEVKRLKSYYNVNEDYHTALKRQFEPYLANHYIKEIYNYRSQFRSDLLAQRTIEHTVDKLLNL